MSASKQHEVLEAGNRLVQAAINFVMDQIQRGLIAFTARGTIPTSPTEAERALQHAALYFASVVQPPKPSAAVEEIKARVRAALDGD